jgi:UDP-N-acetylmuramoyl-L-alanyl-D-glutamate--2,6-diaminopimelate ligase
MIDTILGKIRRIIPAKIFGFFQPTYHFALSFLAAFWYRFPSKNLKVVAITGTKGKSSTTEILNAILEEAGFKTALTNTIRQKIGDISLPNLYKMSMPGRFAMQRFLRNAVDNGCNYAIMEMTSQGALMYRHRFIELDAFVFTNLAPEHIEAHGSYENYATSKASICQSLAYSNKKNKTIIANIDDPESKRFLQCQADKKISYSINDVKPYTVKDAGIDFTFNGKIVHSKLSGLFNLYNIVAAGATALSQGVSDEILIRAIEKISDIPGRVEKVEVGQDFTVIVDYAHTPDSLEKFYKVFESSRNICVLGGTGGGRDTWKRAEMGKIAEKYCDEIILTNEDPYDEDPKKIVDDVVKGITSKKPTIIMDRREAIHEACKRAKQGDSVLITGKGTDPYIMGPNDTKTPWSDANVAREELKKLIE